MVKKTYLNGRVTLHCADALDVLSSMADNSVDLIAMDPPYFRVKGEDWDNQWPTVEAYLAWLDAVLLECWRVLRSNGSIYLFCGHKLATETELLVKARFNLLNHIIWAKPNGAWRRQNKAQLRSFFPATERILFAEHYGAEGMAKGCSGYAAKCAELRKSVFSPLMDYFITAKESLGVTAAEINAATGTKMCSHWFSRSQWQLPSEQQYKALQELFSSKAQQLSKPFESLQAEYVALGQQYQTLAVQYADLKTEYERLRRPFSVTADVPYTDVWTFAPVAYYPGKHPCEKPQDLMRHIIQSSSVEGQVVADFFMGSGATGKSCIQLGREFIGVELEAPRFEQTCAEIEEILHEEKHPGCQAGRRRKNSGRAAGTATGGIEAGSGDRPCRDPDL
jgi:adenine-specific DNA-methyltransferase